MLVFANKAFKLGGPFGMARSLILIVLAAIALVIWVGKSIFGDGSVGSLDNEVKTTVRKTSSWVDGLKKEWDDAKKD